MPPYSLVGRIGGQVEDKVVELFAEFKARYGAPGLLMN